MRLNSQRMSGLLAMVLLGAASLGLSGQASAIPMDPPPPPDEEPADPGDGTYTPPDGGFSWSRAERFGSTSIASFHWDAPNARYDSNWVHPSGGFPVLFDGCRQPEGTAGYTYKWEKVVPGGTQLLSGPDGNCSLSLNLPEATHQVRLTVSGSYSGQFEKSVPVNDILIVSIGDSYGSGEGNPDIRKSSAGEARWVDERCHRSGYAGPAQAAKAVEKHDPASTVTFLSFACSGATIERFFYQPKDATRPYDAPDLAKPVGIGVLGTYAGADRPEGGQQEPDYANHLPPQIQQVKDAVGTRTIDAFIISGGGNDIGFGPVASVCVLVDRCWDHPTEIGSGNKSPLYQILRDDVAELPTMFSNLAACLQPNKGPCHLRNRQNQQYAVNYNLGLPSSNIYLTEYPNQTRDDDGTTCTQMLEDSLGWGYKIDADEGRWAESSALGAASSGTGLNGRVKAASVTHGWNFVDGVAAQYAGAGFGHGYCATNNWIRRAAESDAIQGGGGTGTKGTLHPNERGHQVYRDRLLAHMLPRLFPGAAVNVPPAFATNDAVGGSTARAGDASWLTGRCEGATCTSDWAGMTVTATDSGGIYSATESINENATCAAPPTGVICQYNPGTGTTSSWAFRFIASGTYRLEFAVRAVDGQTETFARDVKVDLNDPTTSATPVCTQVNGLCRSPLSVSFTPRDLAGGSGVTHVEYRLDGGILRDLPAGESLRISSLGTHTITYRAVDGAGRRAAAFASLRRRIVAPTATSISATKKTDVVKTGGLVDKRAVAGQTMTVSLHRKVGDSWKKLQSASPTLAAVTGGSRYAASFVRPRAGSCKVVSRYPGEDRYLPSTATYTFRC